MKTPPVNIPLPSFEETRPPVDVPSTIPVFSLRGALSPLLLIPLALPLLVIMFAPVTILELWPWALRFTDWVQRMLPFMNMKAHANSTAYSQVALLAHSLTVAIIPIMSLVWFWQSMVNYPQLLARRRALGRFTLKYHLFLALIGPPFCLGIIYFFVALPGDPSFARGFTTHSRFGLAFMSFFLAYGSSMILGGQILLLRLFIDTHLRKGA